MILLQQGFLKSLKSEGKAAGTLAITRGWLEHFEDFCLREGVTEPTPDDLSRYHQALLWRPGPGGELYAPNTVNQAIGAIRSFLRWAHHSGFLESDVGAHLRMRHVTRSRRVLTLAERRRLLELPDPRTPLGTRDRALLGLFLETGIARTACARLDLQDLSLEVGVLRSVGRTRRFHTLPDGLVDDLAAYLERARPMLALGTPALFVTRDGGRMKPVTVGRVLKTYAEAADVTMP